MTEHASGSRGDAAPGLLHTTVRTDVARSGDGRYAQYRIPAMVVTASGTVIAGYDGRRAPHDLPGHIDNLVRISRDGGRTWGEQVVQHTGPSPQGFGDPSLGVNARTGRVFLFYTGAVRQGFFSAHAGIDPADPDVLRNVMAYSDDDGASWQHTDITASTKDPAWRGTFAASGRATFVHTGPFADRLVQQYVIRTADDRPAAVSAWTDDNGATWQHGEPVAIGYGDENKVAVTSGGDLLLNMRGKGHRHQAISTDGGRTWGPVTPHPQLIDPDDNGTLIRVFPELAASDPRSRWMLSSNNDDPHLRRNTTVRLSRDDGRTFTTSMVLEAGPSAYSTLDMIDDHTVGVLYERGDYAHITFAAFPLSELTGRE